MNKNDLKAFTGRLHELRHEIQRLSDTTADDRRPVQLDQAAVGRLSRMDAMQGQAMHLETERRRTLERRRIDAALQRIEEDEFGNCVSCGDAIESKRLQHDPSVPTCLNCAKG